MKAPPRPYSRPTERPAERPTRVSAVSVFATAERLAQSVGISASVKPAAAHRSVLTIKPRVKRLFARR
jgi:hypothetical protein